MVATFNNKLGEIKMHKYKTERSEVLFSNVELVEFNTGAEGVVGAYRRAIRAYRPDSYMFYQTKVDIYVLDTHEINTPPNGGDVVWFVDSKNNPFFMPRGVFCFPSESGAYIVLHDTVEFWEWERILTSGRVLPLYSTPDELRRFPEEEEEEDGELPPFQIDLGWVDIL